MSDISQVIMKFERLMGHSHEELMEIGRQKRISVPSESDGEIIGAFTYNPQTGEETYTPAEKYNSKVKSK
jgi:hypothetical protein